MHDGPMMHKTSFPPGRGKFAPEYQDLYWTLIGCYPNLEAPDWILKGGAFWGSSCHEALPKVAPRELVWRGMA